ncbi:MAG: VOC family protein [Kutzneria sp.]|nr:VOC family protein [Kutzneria sp.]MBV9845463.1 VOC family protein [Kutzneria sp.]
MTDWSMPNVFTADVERAVAFYRDHLGFTVSYHVADEGQGADGDRLEHAVLHRGDSRLALSTPRAVHAAGLEPGTGNTFELLVHCANVDRDISRLRAAGITVLREPYDHPGGHRRAYVAGPDGTWVALVDAG